MVRWQDFLMLLMAFLAVGALLILLAGVALPRSRRPAVWRRTAILVLALNLLLPGAWYTLMRLALTDTADGLVTLLLGLFCGQLALAGWLLLRVLWRAGARAPSPSGGVRLDRRRFLLQGSALALPAAAAATGIGGVVESTSPVRLRRETLHLPGLPDALRGLRILHFADVHLWNLVRLPDLERALRLAPRGQYDLVCVTGDLANDMTQLPRALELIAELAAPLGHYACLGNHEHAKGLQAALAAYAAGPVTLLRASGKRLQHRGQPFVVAGIDDLRAVPRISQHVFYPDQIRRALGPTAPEEFSILLSHRPSVLPYAAQAGVDLVLAGHTHGGQLAIGGRSILEIKGATPWAWGTYRHQDAVMHVTCGLGQWFPFRLGCPPEMVLLELQPLAAG